MFIKSCLSTKLPLLRYFSSLEPHILKTGDILRQRYFSSLEPRILKTGDIMRQRYFSSLEPRILKTGDILRQTRIFSSEDVVEYSKVSRDSNPLHFNSESARNAGFDDRLVHGMLVASMFPQIISSHFPGAVYVSQSLYFRLPVYIGDEVLGKVQALNVREIKKRYLVKFSTKCVKNGELLLLDGEAMTFLPNLAME